MNYNSELENIFQGQLKWDRRRIKFLAAFIYVHDKILTVMKNSCDLSSIFKRIDRI